MIANELRIGNHVWVTFNEDESGFGKDYISTIEAIQRNKVMVKGDLHWHPIDAIKEVLLTPDVLEDCGFDKDVLEDKWFNGEIGWIEKSLNGFLMPDSDGESSLGCELITLHHLENIYFALTHQELNYQP